MAARGGHPHSSVLESFARVGEAFTESELQHTPSIRNEDERTGDDHLGAGLSDDPAALPTRTSRKRRNEDVSDQIERSSIEHSQDIVRMASTGAAQLSNLS